MKNHAIHSPQPILSLHLAVMMFGLSGVIGRIVHVSSVTLAGGRVLCSSLVLLAMLLFRKQSLRAVSGKDTMLTCLAGLLLAAHWTSFFQSVRMASVAIGTITYSTFPLFLLVLALLCGLLMYFMTKNALVGTAVGAAAALALLAAYYFRPSWFGGRTESVLRIFDFATHFEDFAGGSFSLTNLLFFISYIAAGVILTVQSLLKRRWS